MRVIRVPGGSVHDNGFWPPMEFGVACDERFLSNQIAASLGDSDWLAPFAIQNSADCCAYCGQPLQQALYAWRSSSGKLYCSEFCADEEAEFDFQNLRGHKVASGRISLTCQGTTITKIGTGPSKQEPASMGVIVNFHGPDYHSLQASRRRHSGRE
jgi:hypothetical protein